MLVLRWTKYIKMGQFWGGHLQHFGKMVDFLTQWLLRSTYFFDPGPPYRLNVCSYVKSFYLEGINFRGQFLVISRELIFAYEA